MERRTDTSRPAAFPARGVESQPLPSEARLEKLAALQWRIYSDISDLIRFGDAKAGVLLATNGALAAVLLRALSDNKALSATHPLLILMAGAAGLALMVSVAFCLKCIIPARRAHGRDSLLYFGHLAQRPEPEYEEYLQDAQARLGDPQEALRQISRQVWINARVADRKYEEIRRAVIAFGVSLVCALGAVLSLMW